MKISSLWVAGNPQFSREFVSFCSLGTQVKLFHSKFSQFEVLIHSKQVSASWFHSCCVSPHTSCVLSGRYLKGLCYHSRVWVNTFAFLLLQTAEACRASSTLLISRYKPSPGVSPGHSPEGTCPAVGSKPPFWLATVQACLEPLLCCSMAVPWMKAPLNLPHRCNTEISFSNWKGWRHGKARLSTDRKGQKQA